MAIPKDYVCEAFHMCFLNCYNCRMIDEASDEQKKYAARHLKMWQEYLKGGDWMKYKKKRSKLDAEC